jgi:hypothetical protein
MFAVAWIFIVLVAAVVLYLINAKGIEAERHNAELIESLYNLVYVVDNEVLFTDQDDDFFKVLENARQLSVVYEETHPRRP